jgi:hypothetical protein
MSDEPNQGPATETPEPESPLSAAVAAETLDEHPELLVGAAFVGGFVAAQILKKVAE